ncbi:hypothetical protein N0V93_008769 [Gnomoniopsis smithogilvyi]|uniref:DUF1917-domain-containing protein n=1 Tax=Gnomoniopsis smithogilvyi TaxID=1191159 RepID=A0A9W8YML7_9PEZI|nr:hypothetical protein N0V93_008769 [Gnomoniopsis smithogilvyi]
MDSDSDFYGDEEEIRELESRVAQFDPSTFWQDRETLTMAAPYIKSESSSTSPAPATQLHNPYEGQYCCAKQLNETIEGFLSRLPPATTNVDSDIPWIYVANPYIPRQDRGGEEAPVEFGADLGKFIEGGEKRLEMCSDFVRVLEARPAIGRGGGRGGGGRGGPTKAMMSREIAKEKAECVDDILMLAKVLKVATGKWMLFIEPAYVNDVWATVARATVKNELGIAAKVAPREERGSKKERLICIYTYDFSDKDDVGRVLARMKQLDLVRTGPGRRPIYYKAEFQDAYTHLGIAGGNPWGLKASLYSSNDIFAHIGEKFGKTPLKREKEEEEDIRRPEKKIKKEEDSDAWTF